MLSNTVMAEFPIARLARSGNCQPSPSMVKEDCPFYPEVFPLGHRLIRSTNEHYVNFSEEDFRYPMVRSTNEHEVRQVDVPSFETKSGILCSTIMLYGNVFTLIALKGAFDMLKG
jgi:hypothetical protein